MSEDTGLILFADTECTGLRAERHYMLEVGCVLTDLDLNEKWRFHAVLRPPIPFTEVVALCRENNAFPFKKHTANGLLAEVEALYARWSVEGGNIGGYREVQDALQQGLMEACGGVTIKPLLGGRSVGFDRRFLEKYMPLFYGMLSHRDVNLSSFYSVWEAWSGEKPPAHSDLAPTGTAGDKHRVMYDIDAAIAEARVYRAALDEWGSFKRSLLDASCDALARSTTRDALDRDS